MDTLKPGLTVVDPASVGFDAARLARLDDHFRPYVDDGRLPGWQLMVSRSGKVVHLSSYAPLFANYNHTQWNPDLAFFSSGAFIGDYQGAIAGAHVFYPVWVDGRNTAIASTGIGNTDIFTNVP